MPQFAIVLWISAGLGLAAAARSTGPGQLWLTIGLALGAIGAWLMALRAAR